MDPIRLAHQPRFNLGALSVCPETRTVRRDAAEEVLEPRVMQVLVVLAAANGHVVSRDDLVERCWDGRIVGDDAINRIISRLRRLTEGIGRDVFAIETITKVGYRLRRLDEFTLGTAPVETRRTQPKFNRRVVLAGGLGGAAAISGVTWLTLRSALTPDVPPATVALMMQANLALRQGTREGQTQAIGIYRQVVADLPGYADGWGSLGVAYGFTARYRPLEEAKQLQDRGRQAGQRALSIDPANALGRVAVTTAGPLFGRWLACERAMIPALDRHPGNEQLLFALITLFGAVGRTLDALAFADQIFKTIPPTPSLLFTRVQLLWGAGRADETDSALEEASKLYPTHFAIWFSRFYIAMYSGRPEAAIALAADQVLRPSGIPHEEIDGVVRVARAIANPTASAVDAVMREQLSEARQAAGKAENAAQIAAALGRVDDSFDILNAYYFAQGFDPGEVRFDARQGTSTPRNDRLTTFLFNPPMKPVRADPRFAGLVDRLGLSAYWRASKEWPDYRNNAPR